MAIYSILSLTWKPPTHDNRMAAAAADWEAPRIRHSKQLNCNEIQNAIHAMCLIK